MRVAFDYRKLADEQRRKANATPLVMVRLKHLSAAERWDRLAEEFECRGPRAASDPQEGVFC